LIAVGHIFIVSLGFSLKNSTVWVMVTSERKGEWAMNAASNWTVESIEIPASVLWKRTLLLTVVSIGIGLGAGYVLGRSLHAKEPPTNAARPPVTQVRFVPLSDADPGERALIVGKGIPTDPMPKAWDSPELILPAVGSGNPAMLRLDDAAPRQPDKG
jgi:hypothetical protein